MNALANFFRLELANISSCILSPISYTYEYDRRDNPINDTLTDCCFRAALFFPCSNQYWLGILSAVLSQYDKTICKKRYYFFRDKEQKQC